MNEIPNGWSLSCRQPEKSTFIELVISADGVKFVKKIIPVKTVYRNDSFGGTFKAEAFSDEDYAIQVDLVIAELIEKANEYDRHYKIVRERISKYNKSYEFI